MRGNKYPKAKIIVSTVFVAMTTKETHTTSREESIVDIHNISKYHFLRISWSEDINFLMLTIKQDCQIFYPTGVPTPINFQVISPKKLPIQR